jgi:Kef-type K+ transport system membrane component KefB|uniref:cation:proton antiporter n=1 Tax=Prosthecobacter sp. TaxID=1965333 RepID=UPI003783D5E4
MIFSDVFTEIAVLLLISAVAGALGLWLKQPLIVSFIAAGIIMGPSVLGMVSANDQVGLLAGLGISLLLFVVGLKLDLHIIRAFGPVALATGLGQVFFTSVVGFFLALALGMAVVPAIYVAVALTFSSTIIIVKLLSDKKETDTLHGRIAIGFLIVQDIVVVLVMIGLTAMGSAGDTASLGAQALAVLGKGAAFIAVLAALMKWVLTPLLRRLGRSRELLVLSAVAWAVTLSAAAHHLGFSKEVGAFLAGVSIASTPYREVIGSRLVSLRDFLLLFFFIDLGAHLDLGAMTGQVLPALALSVFVLVGNPLIVMVIMGAMGYRKRTGFLAGLTVAQISEFSLILGALGMRLGHLDAGVMGVITLVGLITISLSTYMILYSGPLYERLEPWLRIFERKNPGREANHPDTKPNARPVDVIVFGLGRYGMALVRELESRDLHVMGVDSDPGLLRGFTHEGMETVYGDAEDPGFLASLPLDEARWVVNSIRDKHVNQILLHGLEDCGYRGCIAVTANSDHESASLREMGAHLALTPFADAAADAVRQLLALPTNVSENPTPTASA